MHWQRVSKLEENWPFVVAGLGAMLVALIVARMVIQRLDRVIALLEQGVG